MNYLSLSQTDTKIVPQQNDSTVVLPSKLMLYMVQDLVRYDLTKQEVIELNNNLRLRDEQIAKQDSLSLALRKKCIAYQSTITEYQYIDEANTRAISSLKDKQRKTKRQRNGFIYFSMTLLGALILR